MTRFETVFQKIDRGPTARFLELMRRRDLRNYLSESLLAYRLLNGPHANSARFRKRQSRVTCRLCHRDSGKRSYLHSAEWCCAKSVVRFYSLGLVLAACESRPPVFRPKRMKGFRPGIPRGYAQPCVH